MKFTEDAKRLLRENLDKTWQKSVAVLLFILAALPAMGVVVKESLPLTSKVLYASAVLVPFLVIYLIYFLVYSLRRAYRLVPETTPVHSHLADILSSLFGLRKTSLALACTIKVDGSSETTYDVELMAETKGITQIEYLSSAPSLPDGSGEFLPQFISSTSGGITMTVEILKNANRQCFWAINFSPELKPRKPVKYRHRLNSPSKTFAVSAEEMETRKLSYESYSTLIAYPTDCLCIRVTFDAGAKPSKVAPDVWLGLGRVRHLAEYARIFNEAAFTNDKDDDGKLYGQLLLKYPIHGLRYVVTWVPERAGTGAARNA